MDRPCEIAWRQPRIEKAVKPRRAVQRHVFQNFFDADNPFPILIEPESAGHARICAISAHDQTCSDLLRGALPLKMHERPAFRISQAGKTSFRHPFDASLETTRQESLIQQTHPAHTE